MDGLKRVTWLSTADLILLAHADISFWTVSRTRFGTGLTAILMPRRDSPCVHTRERKRKRERKRECRVIDSIPQKHYRGDANGDAYRDI